MPDDEVDGSGHEDALSVYSFLTSSDASMSLVSTATESDWEAGGTRARRGSSADSPRPRVEDGDVSMGSVDLGEDTDGSRDGECPDDNIPDNHATFAGNWTPGWTVGDWIGRQSPLLEQGRVLAANVVIALRRMPREALRGILRAFEEDSFIQKRTRTLFIDAAACLLRIPAFRLKAMYYELQGRMWDPAVPRTQPGQGHALAADSNAFVADNAGVLLTLSRTALSCCVSGGSMEEYTKQVARLVVEGVSVGDQHHSRHFMDDAVYLGARCLQLFDAADGRTPLKGLGIRSSLTLLLDGVPVGGASLYGRHGSVTVLCVNFVSPHTHRLHSRCIGYAIQRRGHGGEEVAAEVLEVLESAPLGLTLKELRACLVCIGGDGASVRGGPERSRPGTQAGEHIWFRVFPSAANPDMQGDDQLLGALGAHVPRPRVGWPPQGWEADGDHLHASTEWDKFHRQDMVLVRAINNSVAATELYTVCKMMDHMFGLGDGRMLVRNAAEATNTKLHRGCLPGMTRKAVGLCAEPGHLLGNFKAYAAALHVREAWRQEDHKTYTQAVLVDAGRRLTSLSFVAFALLFRDVMKKTMAPWALAIQSACVEPWVLEDKRKKHLKVASEGAGMLHWLRELLRVLVLLRQWAPVRDLRALTRALGFATPRRCFPNSVAWGIGECELGRNGFRGSGGRASQWICPSADVCFAERFPAFMLALNDLLHGEVPNVNNAELVGAVVAKSSFADVPLTSTIPPQHVSQMCLGPHCQCSFLAQERRGRHKGVQVWWPSLTRVQPGQRRGKDRRRAFRLPAWVMHSPQSAVAPHNPTQECGTSLHYACPSPVRFHWQPVLSGRPEGVHDTFRDRVRCFPRRGAGDALGAGHAGGRRMPSGQFTEFLRSTTSRCQVPSHIPSLLSGIDDAIVAAQSFLKKASEEDERMYGAEGSSAGMARVLKAMCQCFDWTHLVSNTPRPEHVQAFGLLFDMLRPYLKHTEWPGRDAFPKLVRGWPSREAMQAQYVVLMRRVRQASPKFHSKWFNVKGYRVVPVCTFQSVLWFTTRVWGGIAQAFLSDDALVAGDARKAAAAAETRKAADARLTTAFLSRIASTLSSLLGAGIRHWPGRCKDVEEGQEETASAPVMPVLVVPSVIQVSTSAIRRLGFPWQGRKRPQMLRRGMQALWEYRRAAPGSLGTLALPGSVGKLVCVQEILLELDGSAVSATIDENPFFARGTMLPSTSTKAVCAWHAVRIHHHCRPMGASEACCERVGSIMNHFWGKNPSRGVSNLMDATLLRDGDVTCCGNPRDEMICKQVRDVFVQLGRHAVVARRLSQ